jgi:type I restriction enzyme S subunit
MNDELPQGWVDITLQQAGAWRSGGTPSRRRPEFFGKGIRWVKSGDLPDGPILKTEEEITQDGLQNSSAKLMPTGTISMALYGATIGKLGIMTFPAATNQACTNVIPDNRLVESNYLFYYLLSERRNFIEQGQGGAQPNISQEIVRTHPFRLAPLAEQRRIVAKVEKLFGQVDSCQHRLAKIPALLKRFRQSVLAAACSGRLTADWREENLSPTAAAELLAKIEQERKRAAGKLGSNRRDPVQIDVSDLPDLPEHWRWATLDQIVEEGRPIIYGIIKPGPHDPKGVPYVRVFEMKDGMIAPLSELRRASPERASKFRRATLKAGDLLISKDGTIGRVAIVPTELEGGNITQHLVRASVHSFLSREFVACAIRSQHSQNWLVGEKKGVALQGVNVEDFRRLPLPIPPRPEQQEIVRRVATLFALADRIEARFAEGRKRVDSITQAILAKAFRGELVPTEFELAKAEGRSFESAEELLERIGRNGEPKGKKTRLARKPNS